MNKNIKHLQKHFNQFLLNCKKEGDDYKKVQEIINKYLKDRKTVTKEEYDYIHMKFQDYLKIAASGAIIALPAGTILLALVVKYSKKVGLDITPSSFK